VTRALEQSHQVRIPDRALLEEHYSKEELDLIERVRLSLQQHAGNKAEQRQAWEEGREFLRAMWPDWRTWFAKTTWIIGKDMRLQLLKPNSAQNKLLDIIDQCLADKQPIRVICLKARQLGFSTLIQALHYMWCDLNPFRYSMTLSHSDPAAKELFSKARLMHQRHWFPRPEGASRNNQLVFDEPHHSTFFCMTANNPAAGRGVTLQHVHCSEIPWWDDPEATLTAVHQCVPLKPETSIIYESTAQGAVGAFYDTWQRATKGENNFIPFFAPWFWDAEYQLPFATKASMNAFLRKMSKEDDEYMQRYDLTPEQMQWRRWKINSELHGNERLWDQEFPGEADVAFLTSGSPVFNMEKVFGLKDRVRDPEFRGDIFLEFELPPHREPGGPVPRMG